MVFWAFLPLIIWTLFSLVYYGFPFPNTAYAKLGGAIPFGDRFLQGVLYLIDSLLRDPLTLSLIVIGMVAGFFQGKELKAISWGILLYLLYVVVIGGDFMSGRFLTSLLLASVVILSRVKMNSYSAISLSIFIVLMGLCLIQKGSVSNVVDPNGIADEREAWFQGHSLVTANRDSFKQPDWGIKQKNITVICGGLGYQSLDKRPEHFFY